MSAEDATRVSGISGLPAALAECFPPFDPGTIARLEFAGRLFNDAIVVIDKIVDSPVHDARHAFSITRAIPLLTASYREFAQLFHATPDFWDDLCRYFVDYLRAVTTELEVRLGDVDWSALSEDDCLAIARGKNGLVRAVASALCTEARVPDVQPALEELLVEALVGTQMLDDLQDWREDVGVSMVSLLLRRSSAVRPDASMLESIGRRIYGDGHAAYVLGIGRNSLESALERANALRLVSFAATLRSRIEAFDLVRDRLAR